MHDDRSDSQPRTSPPRAGDLFRIGLTGNIASGKSAVADVWARLGAVIVDADVLAPDGSLDRAAMRRRVFGDEAARRALEAIVHPEVARLRTAEEGRLRERGADVVVLDIPLLFEAGLQDSVDAIVLVDAPDETRIRRLVRDRGLDEAEARAMVRAQMPAAGKRDRADHVIDNDGSLAELEQRAEAVWRELERTSG